MAVQVESSSQIEELLRILRRRFWVIAVPAALIAMIGISYAVIVPKKYVASTQMMVHDTRAEEGGLGRDNTAEARVATHTIRSRYQVKAVLESLGWGEYEALNPDAQLEYLEDIEDSLRVETPPTDRFSGQQLVRITFSHTNRNGAVEFLSALVERWKDEVLEKTRNTLREQEKKAQAAREDQEEIFAQAGNKITDLRKAYGIPPPDPSALPGSQSKPLEFEELERVREQIIEVEERLEELQLELETSKDRYDRMSDTILETAVSIPGAVPENPNSPLIDDLEEKIAGLENAIEINGWMPEHRRRKKVERELADLRQEVASLRADVPPPVALPKREIENPDKQELAEAIALLNLQYQQQITNLGNLEGRQLRLQSDTRELQEIYNQIEEFEADRESAILLAQKYAEDHAELLAQLDYNLGPAGDPFTDLRSVEASPKPTEPNALLISVFAVFAGLAVGLGLALAGEYSKSCFRSVTDIARVMPTPVLGTINSIVTRSQARRSTLRRLALGIGTLAFIGVTSYILWAWTFREELLSDQVAAGIDSLRDALR